jgi:glycosyltransferase involved in cell wall biosynthesis
MSSSQKVLFLCPYPIAHSPSQRFRFEQYFGILQAAGFQVKVSPFLSVAGWRVLYQPGNYFIKLITIVRGFLLRWVQLFTLPAYHWVFIHREAAPLGPPVFEWIIAKVFRKKIIYDFDDAIWLPNTSEVNNVAGFLKWHGKVKHICRWSYKVSAGNHYLCEYAKGWCKQVVYNPTTIDTEALHNPKLYSIQAKNGIRLGWTGSHSTLKYLNELIPMFEQLQNEFPNLTLRVIADQPPQVSLKFVEFVAWNKETEIEDLIQIDIGLMPLTDDAWAKGKCGFKALQYLALGIPAVVSPVGVNTTIVTQGITGFVCSTDEEWLSGLRTLISDVELRNRMGREGRTMVEQHYSVRANASSFVGLFR